MRKIELALKQFLVLLILYGCVSTVQSKGIDTFSLDKLFEKPDNSVIGVIMPGELLPMVIPQCSRPTNRDEGKSWTPDYASTKQFEDLFPEYIEKNKINLGNGGLDRFFRQYFGIYIDGKKYLYINAFSKISIKEKEENSRIRIEYREKTTKRVLPEIIKLLGDVQDGGVIENWKYVPVKVCHGRTTHFGVYYNIKEKKIVDFSFNM